MTHQFIYLDGDIMTLDNYHEIDDAIDALEAIGVQSAEVYTGGPEEERSTDLVLTSGGIVRVRNPEEEAAYAADCRNDQAKDDALTGDA